MYLDSITMFDISSNLSMIIVAMNWTPTIIERQPHKMVEIRLGA